MVRIVTIFSILLCNLAQGQTKQDYIIKYAQAAVEEMEHAKIPASITLAQGILESRYGLSDLSSKSNNHFGIKCHKGWEGQKTYYDDDAKGECFRKYNSPEESFRDHSEFLTTRSRYSELFHLSIHDYKGWAKGLKKAGYATNPKYADHLIKIIEEEQLFVFDRMTPIEVAPYLASLQLDIQPNQVYTVNSDSKSIKKPTTIRERFDQQESNVKIQGGPAGDLEDSEYFNRNIFIENDAKTVWTFSGDTPNSIAKMYGISIDKLSKYNEWPEYLSEFSWGMKVYLQPKRTKSRDRDKRYHQVGPGETMYQIAQLYGIKTEKLYKINRMDEEIKEQPKAGQMISLRKKLKRKPLIRLHNETITDQQIKENSTPDPEISQRNIDFHDQNQTEIEQIPVSAKPTVKSTSSVSYKPVEETTERPKPRTILENDDPWATYPSTKVSEPTDTTPSTIILNQTKNEPTSSSQPAQQNGRSIIYEPTPPVNQKPIGTYQPNNTNSNSSRTNSAKPEQSRPMLSNQSMETNSTQTTTHQVVKGDTLYGISKKYNVTINQIKEWNNLTGNTIKIGQKLSIKQ